MFILTINPYINIFMVIENLHSGPRGRKYPFKGNYLGKLFGPVPFVPPYILVQFTIYPWPFPSQLRNIIFPFVGILERNYFLPFLLGPRYGMENKEKQKRIILHKLFGRLWA